MTNTLVRYGIRSGVIVVVLSWLNFYATRSLDPAVGQMGSVIVLFAMIPFILGSIRELKRAARGKLAFWSAFFGGAGVAALTGAFMFVSTIIFMFVNKGLYEEWSVGQPGSNAGAEMIEPVVMNPFEQGFIMLLIVLVIGSILSLLFAIFMHSPATSPNK